MIECPTGKTKLTSEEYFYKRGVYLDMMNATLKDLRNGFIDTGQLDQQANKYFQFLISDLPGDIVHIDND